MSELMMPFCPRCLNTIDASRDGQLYSAVSRIDDQTEICSNCGADEVHRTPPASLDVWPLPRDEAHANVPWLAL